MDGKQFGIIKAVCLCVLLLNARSIIAADASGSTNTAFVYGYESDDCTGLFKQLPSFPRDTCVTAGGNFLRNSSLVGNFNSIILTCTSAQQGFYQLGADLTCNTTKLVTASNFQDYCIQYEGQSLRVTCSPQLDAPQVCRPALGVNKDKCSNRMAACETAGVIMKWSGPGCKDNSGGNLGDGGCQCQGYCGYQCPKACGADTECFWNHETDTCWTRPTSTTPAVEGAPMPECVI